MLRLTAERGSPAKDPRASAPKCPAKNNKAFHDSSTESARGRVAASQVDPLAPARGILSALFIMAVLVGSVALGGILGGLPVIALIVGGVLLFVAALCYGVAR